MSNTPLDLRQTKCPLNFVKAKLALEKQALGTSLELWVWADSDSATNLPNSFKREGQQVETSEALVTDASQRPIASIRVTRLK
ncbi:MAG: sulfurtransferase TusA family protein [Vampirovibrionales bacterium]